MELVKVKLDKVCIGLNTCLVHMCREMCIKMSIVVVVKQ